MAKYQREYKPRDEYLRDKIAYHEKKLLWEYEELAKIDPDFRPNLIPNTPIQARATVINDGRQLER